MASKLKSVLDLAHATVLRTTSGREGWQDYLSAAARLYKYPFEQQILIHAQRPAATACAPIQTWNALGRMVNRGSKGMPC